ncbi:MAG: putative Myo-inositol 2-dehydrogenase [Promethearchaeota archaeon]|nr:MAG: putative Myo-inositol 2-dehydrogenase [Candidatus Lokiarchaeota archaeon]
MASKRLKVGVIGCGMVGNIGHLPSYQKSSTAEIVAIADPLKSHLKRAQSQYNVTKTYENANDLIDDPDIDAISICSPHWLHAEQAIRAAKNGKHILCEKPIGLNLEEVDKIIKAVEKNKVIFQTATQKRFDPGFQYIKENLEKEQIGTIFQASVFWYHSMKEFSAKQPPKELIQEIGLWRLTDKRCGGGDLLDHGPHYFDLFRWWFGEVESVNAHIRRIHKSRVNEDHSVVTLTFKGRETVAIFERSEAVFGEVFGEEGGRIHGTKGTYYFDVPSEYKKKPMKLIKYTKEKNASKASKTKINIPKSEWEDSYAREIKSFINQVLGCSNEEVGFPLDWIPTIYDGRAALEIVLAAYESQRKKKRIQLPLKNYTSLNWTENP